MIPLRVVRGVWMGWSFRWNRKKRGLVSNMCGTIKILPLSAERRPNFGALLWKILERDVKQQINNQSDLVYNIRVLLFMVVIKMIFSLYPEAYGTVSIHPTWSGQTDVRQCVPSTDGRIWLVYCMNFKCPVHRWGFGKLMEQSCICIENQFSILIFNQHYQIKEIRIRYLWMSRKHAYRNQ
jgi:hypothetical protein